MGQETVSILFVKFIEGLKEIDLRKVIQVSLDKPLVNWKSCKKVKKIPEWSRNY